MNLVLNVLLVLGVAAAGYSFPRVGIFLCGVICGAALVAVGLKIGLDQGTVTRLFGRRIGWLP